MHNTTQQPLMKPRNLSNLTLGDGSKVVLKTADPTQRLNLLPNPTTIAIVFPFPVLCFLFLLGSVSLSSLFLRRDKEKKYARTNKNVDKNAANTF